MRKCTLLFAAIVSLLFSPAFAQQLDRCSTTEVMNRLKLEDPGYQERLNQIEAYTQEWIKNNDGGTRVAVTIPVVVHVIWNVASENITDAQVQTQIDVLNEDFRRLNPDVNETRASWLGVAADCEINFCLAQRDPNGNATSGITHKNTTKTSFSTNDNVKFDAQGGENAWPRDQYLNIWCCDLSGGTIGYAQFPGGPANTDGVVCDYFYFGRGGSAHAPYDLGRTGTHEVGHWLNCFHIWGDDGTSCNGSDQCADTPNQADQTFGCPLPTIRISCTNGPNGDMYENYMDYTDDGCMNIFTLNQKSRMQALFGVGGSRASLLTSLGCVPPDAGCSDNFEPNNTKGTATSITPGVSIQALIANSTDLDWFKFNNSAGSPNIRVTLSNLPANYNLQLFDPSNVKIATSKNSGTLNEEIIFNTSTVGTYKAKVFGASGAFDVDDCYTLLAEISSSPFRFASGEEASQELLSAIDGIYPNPSNGNLSVVYYCPAKASIQLLAYDMTGRVVFSADKFAVEGDNTFDISLPDLSSGIYTLVVKNGAETSHEKFSIQK